MTLWNPTLHPVTIHPRVPVTREYLIRDPNGAIVPAEVHYLWSRPKKETAMFLSSFEYLPVSEATKKIPGRMSTAQHQYLFQASLPALGYSTYYFEATRTKKKKIQRQKGTTTANQACVLQSEVGQWNWIRHIYMQSCHFISAFARGVWWTRSFETYCQLGQRFSRLIHWAGILLVCK